MTTIFQKQFYDTKIFKADYSIKVLNQMKPLGKCAQDNDTCKHAYFKRPFY